jgi:diketogulonate reductase-like aldo/keto reductase
LNDGRSIPWLGLGTWRSSAGDEAYRAVLDSIELGYRHIDTAAFYKNEESVGQAVRDSGVPRGEVFVTTKVWNDALRAGSVAQAVDDSLRKLNLGYIDLMLVHWPVREKHLDAYQELQRQQKAGKLKSIGVSNFLVHHLDDLKKQLNVVPVVNQIEWHVWLQSKPLVERCQRDGIVVEAWSPLMQGKIGEVKELATLATKYGKTPAQVALRWGLQRGLVMIPKSVKRHRIEENAKLFDFALDEADVNLLNSLDRNHRIGPNPDTISF